MDAVGGHIPGATNIPSTEVLTGDGAFLSSADLTKLLTTRGIDDGGATGVYCGSGVTAAIVLAAMASTGVSAALFPGSWSEWSSDPARPVARGAD